MYEFLPRIFGKFSLTLPFVQLWPPFAWQTCSDFGQQSWRSPFWDGQQIWSGSQHPDIFGGMCQQQTKPFCSQKFPEVQLPRIGAWAVDAIVVLDFVVETEVGLLGGAVTTGGFVPQGGGTLYIQLHKFKYTSHLNSKDL